MPLGKVRICCDAVGDLLAEQHAAAAGFGALSDHDFDGVGLRRSRGFMP